MHPYDIDTMTKAQLIRYIKQSGLSKLSRAALDALFLAELRRIARGG